MMPHHTVTDRTIGYMMMTILCVFGAVYKMWNTKYANYHARLMWAPKSIFDTFEGSPGHSSLPLLNMFYDFMTETF